MGQDLARYYDYGGQGWHEEQKKLLEQERAAAASAERAATVKFLRERADATAGPGGLFLRFAAADIERLAHLEKRR